MKTDQLIADFIGTRLERRRGDTIHEQQWTFTFCNGYYPNLKNMKFQTSWDWLMPVVEKIGGMWSPDSSEISIQSQHICELPLNSHIQQVYKEVVDFIKWYNSCDGVLLEKDKKEHDA